MEQRERYDNLDGLRAISCLCIIAMHIAANATYELGIVGREIVGSWTHFVPLFLMISGFGMFCGYYERFKTGSIDLNSFYTKRYKKLLPFFITLIVIDIVMDRSLAHLIEGLTETTLVFGLLPNNQLDVIGVSWTLGVIFLFYIRASFLSMRKRSKLFLRDMRLTLMSMDSTAITIKKNPDVSMIAGRSRLVISPERLICSMWDILICYGELKPSVII